MPKDRYTNPGACRARMMEDDPGQEEVINSYTTEGGNLDDSDWNTRRVE